MLLSLSLLLSLFEGVGGGGTVCLLAYQFIGSMICNLYKEIHVCILHLIFGFHFLIFVTQCCGQAKLCLNVVGKQNYVIHMKQKLGTKWHDNRAIP